MKPTNASATGPRSEGSDDAGPNSPVVVIAGASGFLGRHLSEPFTADGFTVRTIGRGQRNDGVWGGDLVSVLEGADAVINLAGRTVNCRYNKRNADAVVSSRVLTTRELGTAMQRCANPPRVWLNASTGTIYRDPRDRGQTETDGELGCGFSESVAKAWEAEFYEAPVQARRVALRLTIILGPDGGGLAPLINLSRVGLGGTEGDGGQRMSWLHIDDCYRAIRFVLQHEEISGPVNLATEHSETNRDVMRLVRANFGGVGAKFGLPLPAAVLEMGGARVVRTETELVLKSRWVVPQVLREAGFTWQFPHLDEALADLSRRTKPGFVRF